jgi:hypothetical protein
MEIRYRVTQDVRDVDDGIARTLIARHLADAVHRAPERAPVERTRDAKPAKSRRGKYRRRDLRAAD